MSCDPIAEPTPPSSNHSFIRARASERAAISDTSFSHPFSLFKRKNTPLNWFPTFFLGRRWGENREKKKNNEIHMRLWRREDEFTISTNTSTKRPEKKMRVNEIWRPFSTGGRGCRRGRPPKRPLSWNLLLFVRGGGKWEEKRRDIISFGLKERIIHWWWWIITGYKLSFSRIFLSRSRSIYWWTSIFVLSVWVFGVTPLTYIYNQAARMIIIIMIIFPKFRPPPLTQYHDANWIQITNIHMHKQSELKMICWVIHFLLCRLKELEKFHHHHHLLIKYRHFWRSELLAVRITAIDRSGLDSSSSSSRRRRSRLEMKQYYQYNIKIMQRDIKG